MSRSKTTGGETTRMGANRRLQRPSPISIWERIPLWAYVLVISLAFVIGGISLMTYLGQLHHPAQSFAPPARAALPNATDVGKPAVGFTLQNANGQAYTFDPGDGKNHLLVFYMGYF